MNKVFLALSYVAADVTRGDIPMQFYLNSILFKKKNKNKTKTKTKKKEKKEGFGFRLSPTRLSTC